MRIELTLQMVRALKGAPISVLFVLMLSGRPESAAFCQRHTGYSDDETVKGALQLLEDYGLVTRNGRYSWQITGAARQLPLMQLAGGEEAEACEPEDVIDATPEKPESDPGKTGVPPSSRSLTTSFKTRESTTTTSADDSGKTGVAATLDQSGIREPARSRLLALPHVTAELVRYHVATTETVGLAIYRIEHKFPIKPGWVPTSETSEPTVSTETDDALDPIDLGEPPTVHDRQVYTAAITDLRTQISGAEYGTWLAPLQLVGRRGMEWWLVCGNQYVIDHVRSTMLDQLTDCLAAASGGEAAVHLGVADALR